MPVLSRKLKPHLVADTVKQYISRAQRTTKKGSQEQQNNMEFLRGVYAFMQIDYSNSNGGYETTLSLVNDTNEATATAMRDAEQAASLKAATATIATRETLAGEEAEGPAASSGHRLAIQPRSAPKRSQRQSQSQSQSRTETETDALLPQNLVMLQTAAVAARTTTDDS
ncbi:hypothetical protein AWZ03_011202 [Drosophila navojoa]|uniref:Uncharacterized protein n=1 Tax=Drosophila navojoa TaxID=7232 RepID=A0A484B0J0_DRONA|nr:hypothetical protein AWZ03_011202 [Drosophila navojoa]